MEWNRKRKPDFGKGMVIRMKKILVWKNWCRKLLEQWKNFAAADRKKAFLLAGGAGVLLILTGIILAVCLNKGDQTVYRETEVLKGNLTVGVTESGNVSIGTSEQTFDLDLSEYTTDSAFSWGTGGGMDGGMAQMFNGTASSSGSDRTLTVEEVYVTAGEEIEKGTPILKLESESVSSIRQELEEDTSDAKLTWQQLLTSTKQTNQQAESSLALNTLYGTGAQAEYNSSVHTLQTSVEDLQTQLEDAKEKLTEDTAELEEKQTLLAEQREVLTNAEYARDNTDRENNLYWWIEAVNTVSDTETLVESLEDETESLEDEIEQQNTEITSLETQLELANKEWETGKATAETQLAKRQYHYENAQEIYDVAVEQSSFETENAEEDYEEANEKLKDFDSMIADNVISSAYNGVITAVGVTVGDSLQQDSSLLTLNDYGEAAITLDVDEEDMESAALGNEVNISFTAFPDEVLKGEVSEIGDAQINSNTNRTTYSVTVSLSGDVTGLYEGMSAEVTFITKESAEVLYVSNRAIIREGTASYVKIKNEKGKIEKKEVVTGFSDGMNVEVKEGLSEGDMVLVESSVSQS